MLLHRGLLVVMGWTLILLALLLTVYDMAGFLIPDPNHGHGPLSNSMAIVVQRLVEMLMQVGIGAGLITLAHLRIPKV
jgi:hypothetical protein